MNIINIIIATVTAFVVPGVTSDIYPSEPLPLAVAQVIEPIVIEKKKATTTGEVTCNCFNLLKERFDAVPRMVDIQAQASPDFGSVAVFRYPSTEDWPTGIPHVAVTTGSTSETHFEIEEYNFKSCTHSYRQVPFNDVRLLGFVDL